MKHNHLREQILETCRTDLLNFFDKENGQVGIYDAVNPTSQNRRYWKEILGRTWNTNYIY